MPILDIVTKIYKDTNTNAISYPASNMLIEINSAYNRVVSLIMESDNRWQWDDTNQTDLPIATSSIITGQQDYSLSTSHLTIDRVELKDTSGNWTKLDPIDQHDVVGESLISHLGPGTGIPIQYDKLGNSVFLYPIPNYTQVASLKLYFTRGPALFSSTDVSTGTKQPGFNSLFHELIPLWVIYNYYITKIPTLALGIMNMIILKENEIVKFYGLRNRDERPRMGVSTNSTIGNASGRLTIGASDSNK